jgi:hypothetical protein
MENLNKIKEIVNEVIQGDDKNREELRSLVKGLFTGKTRSDFDKIDNDDLHALKESYDSIIKESDLTEIDRAFLDIHFNQPPKRYTFLNILAEIDEKKLKKIAALIQDNRFFGPEKDKEFMAFIGWILVYENWWDDITLENEKKDLHFQMWFNHIKKYPQIGLLIVGTKKYEKVLKQIESILVENI